MSETEQLENAAEFTVSIQGGQLPPEVLNRIHRAVHRAVLHEIADIDLAPRNGVRFLGLDDELVGRGRTQGIAAQIVER